MRATAAIGFARRSALPLLLALGGWSFTNSVDAARVVFSDNGDGTAELYLLTEFGEADRLIALDVPIVSPPGIVGFSPPAAGFFADAFPGVTGAPVGPDRVDVGGSAYFSGGILLAEGVLYPLGTIEWNAPEGEIAPDGTYSPLVGSALCLPPRGSPLLELASLPGDLDGDLLLDDVDPCPSFPNTDLDDPDGDGLPKECQCGDFDQDGFFSNQDVTLVFGCVPGSAFPTDPASCTAALDVADTNHSGSYDNSDVSAIFGFVPGSPFPNGFEPWALTCARRPAGTAPPAPQACEQPEIAPPFVPEGCPTDTDGDTLCDDQDPCIFFANTLPLPVLGGPGDENSDGIPTECQCGDPNQSGTHDGGDITAIFGCIPGSPFPNAPAQCAATIAWGETNHSGTWDNLDSRTMFGFPPGSAFPAPFPPWGATCARRPEGIPPP